MSYSAFVEMLAAKNGIESGAVLLRDHKSRFSFQLNNRQRGKDYCAHLGQLLAVPIPGLRVLDIGCAYGGISIELANCGAEVCGKC